MLDKPRPIPSLLETYGERRLAFWLILAFWTAHFLLASGRIMLTGLPNQELVMLRRTIIVAVAMGLTWMLVVVVRRTAGSSLLVRVGAVFATCVPLALVYAFVNWMTYYWRPIPTHLGKYMAAAVDERGPTIIVLYGALESLFYFLSWGMMWLAVSMSGQAAKVEREAARYAFEAKQAELRALRYQVNPHFLFNTLNALSLLVMRGRSDEAEQMILNLSTFFRASLSREATDRVPLRDEIALQGLYLDIEKVRFPERLQVSQQVEPAVQDVLVPSLILQPLIENAIKYGVASSQEPVTVTIGGRQEGNRVHLWVADDSCHQAETSTDGCGVGLANVRGRLETIFGEAAQCVAGPRPEGGWQVDLSFPLDRLGGV